MLKTSSENFLLRGVFAGELNGRFVLADTTALCNDAIKIYDADPVAAELFSSALTSTALLSPLLEGTEKYSVQWEYPGLLGKTLVDVNAHSDVRGLFSQPHLAAPELKLDTVFGREDGIVTVLKFDNGSIINSGSAKAPLADFAGDLSFFFSVSDQIETEFITAVRFNADPENPVCCAAGMMLQAMPECNMDIFENCRKRTNTDEFRKILLSDTTAEKKLEKIADFLGLPVPAMELGTPPGFRCNCSRDRLLQTMKVMSAQDLEDIFKDKDQTAVECRFCRQKYVFSRRELIKNG